MRNEDGINAKKNGRCYLAPASILHPRVPYKRIGREPRHHCSRAGGGKPRSSFGASQIIRGQWWRSSDTLVLLD